MVRDTYRSALPMSVCSGNDANDARQSTSAKLSGLYLSDKSIEDQPNTSVETWDKGDIYLSTVRWWRGKLQPRNIFSQLPFSFSFLHAVTVKNTVHFAEQSHLRHPWSRMLAVEPEGTNVTRAGIRRAKLVAGLARRPPRSSIRSASSLQIRSKVRVVQGPSGWFLPRHKRIWIHAAARLQPFLLHLGHRRGKPCQPGRGSAPYLLSKNVRAQRSGSAQKPPQRPRTSPCTAIAIGCRCRPLPQIYLLSSRL